MVVVVVVQQLVTTGFLVNETFIGGGYIARG